MAFSHNETYKFGDFAFDPNRLALYYRDEFIKVEKKSLEVLAVLIERPHELVSTSEIIDVVWRDNPSGVTSIHLAQNISKLRKAFAAHDPGTDYIKNVKGLGYIFDRDVEHETRGVEALVSVTTPPAQSGGQPSLNEEGSFEAARAIEKVRPSRSWFSSRFVIAGVVLLALISVLGVVWYAFPINEEDDVRRVVQESQLYESLVLYRDPKVFKEEDLDKFWTAEADFNSNFDRKRIRTGVRDLLEKDLHYGNETKCEQFEFQSVEIDAKSQMALVKTLEKWFIAVYREDGSLEKNKYVGPYFVSYVLRKTGGKWLVEKSNTARANLPTPQITKLEAVTEPKRGQQFFVKFSGLEFLPQSVYVRVTGEGCPEQNPCIVPNSALLKHGRLTESSLENVPLTLAGGEFTLFVHNSENHPSNPVKITVP